MEEIEQTMKKNRYFGIAKQTLTYAVRRLVENSGMEGKEKGGRRLDS